MSAPPSPLLTTIVHSGRAIAAPTALGMPRPIDWYAVPTMSSRSGAGMRQ